jgi:hypothetical protein
MLANAPKLEAWLAKNDVQPGDRIEWRQGASFPDFAAALEGIRVVRKDAGRDT